MTRPGDRLLARGLWVAVTELVPQVSSFLRSLVLARLLTPENYGIAATFSLVFYLLDMATNLALDKLIIQADEGDNEQFQAALHLVQSARGLLNAAVLICFAEPIASLLGVPSLAWAFRLLALGPAVAGLAHTDIARFQRGMRFREGAVLSAAVSVVVLVTTSALALWSRNYVAVIGAFIVQAACMTIGGHLLAERRYRWHLSQSYAMKALSFASPLLINGILMYFVLAGDRLVIATAGQWSQTTPYSLSDLAVYSVAASLVLAPTVLVNNSVTSLFLPILSSALRREGTFDSRYLVLVQCVSISALIITVPLSLAGDWIVRNVYGAAYVPGGYVVVLLAGSQAFRILRIAPTVAALAEGDTSLVMIGNVVRVIALLPLFVVVVSGGSLSAISGCNLVGEMAALFALSHRLAVEHSLSVRPLLVPVSAVLLVIATSAVGRTQVFWRSPILVAVGCAVIALALGIALSGAPELRRAVTVAWRSGGREWL